VYPKYYIFNLCYSGAEEDVVPDVTEETLVEFLLRHQLPLQEDGDLGVLSQIVLQGVCIVTPDD
jgi:hypothetical protein